MHVKALEWADGASGPLLQNLCFVDPAANTIIVGTGQFSAGQEMPAEGFSQYPMREISIVLEGEIETESAGKTAKLRAGDLVTIPANQTQRSRFLEDTKLLYIFFGHRPVDDQGD